MTTTAVVMIKNTTSANENVTETSLQTVTINRERIEKTLSLNGTIAALESQSVTSELSGVKVKEVKVRVGDHVKEGDVIAVLDTTSIEKSLKLAENGLSIAKQKDALELATAQRNYNNAVELAKIQQERAKRNLDKANNDYNKAVSESNQANNDATNAANKVNEKSSAESSAQKAYADASSEAKQTAKNYENAQVSLETAKSEYASADEKLSKAKEEYIAAYNSGNISGLEAEYDTAKAEYEKAKAEYDAALSEKTNLDEQAKTDDSAEMQEKLKQAQEKLDETLAIKEAKESVNDEKKAAYEQAVNSVDVYKKSMDDAQSDYDAKAYVYEQALNNASNAKTQNENAQSNLESKQNALSEAKSELSEAKADKATKETEAKTKKDGIDTANETVTKAKESQEDQIRENNKTIADSKDSLTSAGLSSGSNTLTAQQEVDKYKEQIEKATIVAPCDGLITSVGVKEGAIYDNGREIAMIQNDSGYKVSAVVDQYDICDVTEGMAVNIKTDSMGDETLTGKVTFVSPIPGNSQASSSQASGVSTTGNDYPIEVSIDTPGDRLRIGMTAKITIIESEQDNALVVPDNVVQTAEDGTKYVELVNADQSTDKVIVTYGVKTDYYVEIKSDKLKEGMTLMVPALEEL